MRAEATRILELDGLRGVAILLVIAFHFVLSIPITFIPEFLKRAMLFGWSGVDLFFVLSGFLIGGILLDHRESDQYFRPFYARRFFRIVPIYFLVLTLLMLFRHLTGQQGGWVKTLGPPMPWPIYLSFTNNIWQAAHNFMDVLLPVTWSLAVEEQFYLSLPLVVRLVRPALFPKIVVGTIVAALLLRTGACLSGVFHQNQIYVLPFFRFDSLMVGVACALLIRHRSLSELLRRNMWVLYSALAMIATSLFVIGGALPEKHQSPATPLMTFGLTLVAGLYAGFLLLAVLRPAEPFCALLRLRPLRFVGKISYCVYLIHQPIIAVSFYWLQYRFPYAGALVYWLTAAATFAIILIIAELSWRYFESRLIPIGHRFQYSPRTNARAVSDKSPVAAGQLVSAES